jgi:hypothetical protein
LTAGLVPTLAGRASVSGRRLRAAARDGVVLDTGSRRPRLAGALVRDLLLRHPHDIDPHGIRVRGAHVTGSLDLAAMTVPVPVEFDDCVFDLPPNVAGADLHALALTGCTLPGLLGNGLRVRRDLDLSRSLVIGALRTSASTSQRSAVWLCEADVGGRILCVDTHLIGTGERAVQADRIRVAGVVRLIHDFVARGEVRLLGAQIGGSLDLTAARLENGDGLALELGDAEIGGSLFLTDDVDGNAPSITGRVDLNSAEIAGQMVVRGLTLRGPGRPLLGRGYATTRGGATAISAPRLRVGAGIAIEGTTVIVGGVDLSGADVGGLTIAGKCRLSSAGATALELTNATVRSSVVLDEGVHVEGKLRLSRATVHGRLRLTGVRLSAPADGVLLDGYGLVLDGAAELQRLRAEGGRLHFNSGRLQMLLLNGARLTNPGDDTLDLRRTTVHGVVWLPRLHSDGKVVLDGAEIAGRLSCAGAVLTGQPAANGTALSAVAATIRGGAYLRWERCEPSVDLTGATTTVLVDDPDTWPAGSLLSGFTYERFGGSDWDVGQRCRWLDRAEFDAGAYEQVARVFRRHGYAVEAERVLIRQRDAAWRSVLARSRGDGLAGRAWAAVRFARAWAFGRTVGYGYRPGRALVALVGLLLVVATALQVPALAGTLRAVDPRGNVYAPTGRLVTVDADAREARTDECGGGQVRCLDPLLYAVDTVVPLVDLGQRATWYADPHAPWGGFALWLLNGATLLGWLLSTILVLSFARLARAG